MKTPPTSWADLYDPKYKGRVIIPSLQNTEGLAEPVRRRPPRHRKRCFAAAQKDTDAGFKKLAGIKANLLTIYTQMPQAYNLLEQGEAWMISAGHLVRSHSERKAAGAPIELAAPKEGVFAMPSGIAAREGCAAVRPGLRLSSTRLLGAALQAQAGRPDRLARHQQGDAQAGRPARRPDRAPCSASTGPIVAAERVRLGLPLGSRHGALTAMTEAAAKRPPGFLLDVAAAEKRLRPGVTVLDGVDLAGRAPASSSRCSAPRAAARPRFCASWPVSSARSRPRGARRRGDHDRRPPHRRDIGVVFQNYALFPHLDVAEQRRLRAQGPRQVDPAGAIAPTVAALPLALVQMSTTMPTAR
jgi:hypothetical protein